MLAGAIIALLITVIVYLIILIKSLNDRIHDLTAVYESQKNYIRALDDVYEYLKVSYEHLRYNYLEALDKVAYLSISVPVAEYDQLDFVSELFPDSYESYNWSWLFDDGAPHIDMRESE